MLLSVVLYPVPRAIYITEQSTSYKTKYSILPPSVQVLSIWGQYDVQYFGDEFLADCVIRPITDGHAAYIRHTSYLTPHGPNILHGTAVVLKLRRANSMQVSRPWV